VSRGVLLAVLVAVLAGPLRAEEGPSERDAELDRVLQSMQQAVDGTKDLTADFTYVRYLADFEDESRKSGKLYYKKPEFVRIDFTKPYEKQVYITPELYQEYRPDTKVVTRVRRDRAGEREGTRTLALAMGTAPSELRERFTLALVNDRDLSARESRQLRVLELIPKREEGDLPQEVVRVWLWIDTGNWLPRRVKSFERDDDTETFVFDHVKTNQKLKDSIFEFEPTDDMVIDDLTSSPPTDF